MNNKNTAKIDPMHITNYNRSDVELQLFFLFCIFVANKPSNITASKVNKMFLTNNYDEFNLKMLGSFAHNSIRHDDENIHSPFAFIHIMVKFKLVRKWLEHWKVGQYARFTRAIHDVHDTFLWDSDKLLPAGNAQLSTIRLNDIMGKITGMGMKSARFFLVHSRWDQPYAILDVHVLKWLNQVYGTTHKKTPSHHKDYKLLEGLFLGECVKWRKGPAEMDTFIWQYYHNQHDDLKGYKITQSHRL